MALKIEERSKLRSICDWLLKASRVKKQKSSLVWAGHLICSTPKEEAADFLKMQPQKKKEQQQKEQKIEEKGWERGR